MSVRNTPGSYGLIAGLLVLLFGLLVNDGCIPNNRRSIEEQYYTAVEIEVTCIDPSTQSGSIGYGTGVIVDASHVITAAHMTTDPGFCVYKTTDLLGQSRYMYVLHVLKDVDLASLTLSPAQAPFPISGVAYGPRPPLASIVCILPAHPRREHKCGEVFPYAKPPGDLVVGMVVEPGNSGSGVYDQQGRLVGIAVATVYNTHNDQYVTGKMSSLEGHVQDLLP